LTGISRLFKQYLNEPETEAEAKWQFIGFFQAIATFGAFFIPEAILANQVRSITAYSPYFFALLLCMFAWAMFFWKTVSYWLRVSQNFGIMMLAAYQEGKKQKQEA
jgi:hypothetical protein